MSFRPPQPVFIGGRQPYGPRLGIPQSGPVPQAPPLRGHMAAATLSLVVGAWQPAPFTVQYPRIAALQAAPVVSSPPLQNRNYSVLQAWWNDPTTVISLASFAPQLAPDQPPVQTVATFNLSIRSWYSDPYPSQGYGRIAAVAPAAPVASQPPVMTRTNLDLLVRGWAPQVLASQGYTDIAPVIPAAAIASPPPRRGYATHNLLIDSWRVVPSVSQGYGRIASTAPTSPDGTPDAFTFATQTGVRRNVVVTSAAVTISGINIPVLASIDVGEYSVNDGLFTNEIGLVVDGDRVRVRHSSSMFYVDSIVSTLTVGGVSGTFTSVTGELKPRGSECVIPYRSRSVRRRH